jgi:hypothetical protein
MGIGQEPGQLRGDELGTAHVPGDGAGIWARKGIDEVAGSAPRRFHDEAEPGKAAADGLAGFNGKLLV